MTRIWALEKGMSEGLAYLRLAAQPEMRCCSLRGEGSSAGGPQTAESRPRTADHIWIPHPSTLLPSPLQAPVLSFVLISARDTRPKYC